MSTKGRAGGEVFRKSEGGLVTDKRGTDLNAAVNINIIGNILEDVAFLLLGVSFNMRKGRLFRTRKNKEKKGGTGVDWCGRRT